MDALSLQNPVFATYALASSILVLKVTSMAWLTVYRMMKVRSGWAAPEDLARSPLDPNPDPSQLEKNEYVERIRRIHHNDLENIPFFLAAGLLFVLSEPSLLLTQGLMGTYVVTRLLHFAAYLTAQLHDVRAAFWTPGSLIILFMAGWSMVAAAGAL